MKVGEQVCAIGIYNAFKQGLVPGGLGADHFIKLVRGKLEQVERTARSTMLSRLFGHSFAVVTDHFKAVP